MSRFLLSTGLALLLGTTGALRLVPIPTTPLNSAPSSVTLPEIQPVSPPVQAPRPSIQPLPSGSTTTAATPVFDPTREPLWPRQWNMQAIQMEAAWGQLGPAQPLEPVTVAVIDTGYVASPELAGRVINGYDFVSNPNRAGDGDGRDPDASGVGPYAYHGEVIANIIGAAHDGQGMAGINPRVKVLHVRVAGSDGLVDPEDLVDALRWAAGMPVVGAPMNAHPARIVNLSLFADFIPLTGCDARIQQAVNDLTARGVLVVSGAANDGANASGYSPAGCRNVLTVTSATPGGQRPAYANWGPAVALAAPGGDSTQKLWLSSLSMPIGERSPDPGTSLSAPHVTGVASLLLGVRPRLTPAQLRSLLTRTATPFPNRKCDPDAQKTCGSGMVNASAALKSALASSLGRK